MKYIDLFGGIGGFSLGIERATQDDISSTKEHEYEEKGSSSRRKGRLESKQTNGLGNNRKWECVYYNDFDKYAVQTYNKNFGTDYEATDITTVKEADIPDHDIICAGFPCQAFSIAGKRRGFKDTRGTLFFEIMRIAKAKGTSYILLENVKGLLNHEKGKTFTKILQTLQELGYEYQWMVLNSKFFGVSQNRERVFIIANLRGKPRLEILPFKETSKAISELSENKAMIKIYKETAFDTGKRNFRESKISPTLAKQMGTGGNNVPMVNQTQLRRLTPKECERLQGFPDDWTKGVSDTQRYKQLGNAVTVNVVEAIVRQWL